MQKTVYTNYWVNERANVKKQHGSFETEDEANTAFEKIEWANGLRDYSVYY